MPFKFLKSQSEAFAFGKHEALACASKEMISLYLLFATIRRRSGSYGGTSREQTDPAYASKDMMILYLLFATNGSKHTPLLCWFAYANQREAQDKSCMKHCFAMWSVYLR